MKDMFDRTRVGVGEEEAVTLKLMLIKYTEALSPSMT